jgi:hypothetical protein
MKAKPPAPPLDPKVVAELGQDRKAVEWTEDQQWELTILDPKGWRAWIQGKRPDGE